MAGHFVMVRVGKFGERIPLTINKSDSNKGTITLIVQKAGNSSQKIADLEEGEYITDMVGPLGKATDIEQFGTVLACCGGVGTAPMIPIIESLKKAGNYVITIQAARTSELLILKDEIKKWSDEVYYTTDDGSEGIKGVITDGMQKVIEEKKIHQCFAIGPAIMMKFSALLTKKYNIPTIASLNAIMVDGTGMCGACRITVGDETKFTCVDGPEFDAHKIDFDELLMRLESYKAIE